MRKIINYIEKNGTLARIIIEGQSHEVRVILKSDFKKTAKEDSLFRVAGKVEKVFLKAYCSNLEVSPKKGDRLFLSGKKYYLNHFDRIFYKKDICLRLYLSLEED